MGCLCGVGVGVGGLSCWRAVGHWLAGCLAGWLPGWRAGGLAGALVAWKWLAALLFSQPLLQPTALLLPLPPPLPAAVVDCKHILLHLDEVKPDGIVNESIQQARSCELMRAHARPCTLRRPMQRCRRRATIRPSFLLGDLNVHAGSICLLPWRLHLQVAFAARLLLAPTRAPSTHLPLAGCLSPYLCPTSAGGLC